MTDIKEFYKDTFGAGFPTTFSEEAGKEIQDFAEAYAKASFDEQFTAAHGALALLEISKAAVDVGCKTIKYSTQATINDERYRCQLKVKVKLVKS